MKTVIRNHMAALMLLVPAACAFVSTPAAAQHWNRVAQPTITSMTLDADRGLTPGSVLRLRVNATPGANWATVTLGDSGIQVRLREQAPGSYSGAYSVRPHDRIDPMQLLSVRLDYAGQVAAQNFSYPASFQALAGDSDEASAGEPVIERFVMRSAGRLERGRELRFRLVGTPGGDAWLDIPGVIRGVDLDEVRPGVYEGTYTIRRRDNLAAFARAVATLQNDGHRSTSRVENLQPGYGPGADESGPRITDLAPQNGDRITDRGRTVISARLRDDGGGVDPSTVRLRVDGQDVTGDARIVGEELRYRQDLAPGRHTVELTVRDRAGNRSTRSWSFEVVDEDRYGEGPLPLRVTSHRPNAVVDADGFAIRGRTVPYANVRVQVESVANLAGLLGLSQPVADRSLQADRNGDFTLAVNPPALPIPGARYDVRLTATSGGQSAEERLTLQPRRG